MIPAAALAAIPALFQTGVGVYQMIQANKLAKDRPTYQRPEEIEQMVQAAKNLAAQRTMPGYNTYADRIGSDAAAAYGRIAEATAGTGAGLGAATQMNVNANRSLQDLGVANANYYAQNQGTLMNALATGGAYADKEFEWNKAQPYMEAARASAAMREGGLQNMMGGLSSGVSGVNSAMLNDKLLELYGYKKPETDAKTAGLQAAIQKMFQFALRKPGGGVQGDGYTDPGMWFDPSDPSGWGAKQSFMPQPSIVPEHPAIPYQYSAPQLPPGSQWDTKQGFYNPMG